MGVCRDFNDLGFRAQGFGGAVRSRNSDKGFRALGLKILDRQAPKQEAATSLASACSY